MPNNKWKKEDYVSYLNSRIEARLDTYSYKLARYLNRLDVDLRNSYNYYDYYTVPFAVGTDKDLFNPASTNVIKSVIDTLVSKLSNNKVRPFFTPTDGIFKTKKVVRQAQQFFDTLYDEVNLNGIVSAAFKDACIFDIGYILVDPFTYEIRRVPSYCIAQLDEQAIYLIKYHRVPSLECNKYDVKAKQQFVNIEMLIDCNSGEATLYVDEQIVAKKAIAGNPVVQVYYNEPIQGSKTISIVDELEGIQSQIDLINARISTTSQLTPANIVFVDESSGIKATDINNKDCQVYPVGLQPGSNADPVHVVRPVPFDNQWQSMLDFYINKAYDMVGISQLSAQSRKPSGLDSGVALQTMEDIESDRFETQINHFIRAYIDTTKAFVATVPANADILPVSKWNDSMKWTDLIEQQDLFKIQYSAATSMSKDPAERAKQIIQMSQVGLITPSKAAELMDMPDLTDAYSDAEALEMAVAAVISNAVDHNLYDIPDYISYTALSREICSEQNQLFASLKSGKEAEANNSEVAESLRRLDKLSSILSARMIELGIISEDEQSQGMPAESDTTSEQPMISDSGLALTKSQSSLDQTAM